ncbi:MAG: hypothetical protein M3O62_02000, partial [Pseudomonadota bacterium]|nr:hypothetical protein [Pseudomonadota bacterium]
LSTVGRSLGRWISDWRTVRSLAPPGSRSLLAAQPVYLGYITSAYKVSSGRNSTKPHEYWEGKIAPRVRDRVVASLRAVDPTLVPHATNKLAAIKDFHSLAPQAQEFGVGIGKLRGMVNSGYNNQISEAEDEFKALAREIRKRTGI